MPLRRPALPARAAAALTLLVGVGVGAVGVGPASAGDTTGGTTDTSSTTSSTSSSTSGSTASTAADSSWTLRRGTRLRVLGHGWGHGHGMSQYGAEGAARKGLGHARILDFYYPGTQTGHAAGKLRIWLSGVPADALVVQARPGLVLRDDEAPRGQRRTVLPDGADYWRLRDGVVSSRREGRWHRFGEVRGRGAFAAGGRPISLQTPSGPRAYRGRLTTTVLPSGQGIVVNAVGVENYLRGVVPQEIPASWSPQAVQAQAVAARTYAAFERYPGNTYYDLCDTGACQVYGGVAAEDPRSDDAVEATRGEILTEDGAPAFTQFGSSNGGWTAAGDQPYLRAREDPYDGWSGNPVHSWSTSFDRARVEAAYPALGRLKGITVLARDGHGDWGGRVERLRLTGTDGRVRVSGDALRAVLGLRSTWFTFRTS